MRPAACDQKVRPALCSLVGAALILGAMGGPAGAIPELQLYIEGGTYDPTSDTWVVLADGSELILWVIGNVEQFGTIFDVTLTVTYPSDETGTLTLTPTTAASGLLPAPGDPSTPAAPTLIADPSSALSMSGGCGSNGTTGTIPCLGDGSKLPPHDIYGAGTSWFAFLLGDFDLEDSPVGDFITSFPTDFPKDGQISAYEVTTDFPEGTLLHFDAFGFYVKRNPGREQWVFAPPSHDAGTGFRIPPASCCW